ncbi:efflux RND transporter periplasmic adaptor subunit [Marivirga sp.]|uniref:efflux RND transporter periplasmic adaptor subunit n=1 Tax=Marivirga sp. TaxID=2018662 RepID=UPI002D7F1D9A|nr:efflux RND transporter periplasmic adaptor subunit [Marivirga sp.]HET8860647.1 efflux RND transporter periplasmic adaptor subunit [Marivirga sp.]
MQTKYKNILKIIGVLALGILLGWLLFGGSSSNEKKEHTHSEVEENTTWTCSMHPQIKRNEPGDCPICGMDLIPMYEMGNEMDPASFEMSENAMKLANIQTITVAKGELSRKIRLNGTIEIDERNSYTQSTHIPGRIERLNINFTGEKVRKGQNLAIVYSPELVTAQEELLQAQSMKDTYPELLDAAIEKLRRWKIGQDQIDRILQNGKALENFPIQADINGIVTEKMVELGDYVERGMPIYEISDLSTVWIMFDLYEEELKWVKEGSEIEYSVNGLPGQTFQGTISFIDPLLDAQTRVASARVEVANKDGVLKPEMFVSGVVQAKQAADKENIVIPKSSVLWTGERSVIYVKEDGAFKMREVTLGASLGDSYAIKEGLEIGEEIVSNGTFTLDAAVQLSGRPSMMNKGREVEERFEISNEAKSELNPLYTKYFELKDALTQDDFQTAMTKAKELKTVFEEIDMTAFQEDAHEKWMDSHETMKKVLEHIHHHNNIEDLRKNFIALSDWMIQLTEIFHPISETLYLQHCPMADNDQGADWLSKEEEIVNPYFGESMLGCGEVVEKIEK